MDISAAQAYEERMVPAFMGEWALKALRYAELEPGEAVVDVACGTGVAARAAAAQVGPSGRVTGVDLDPAMIEVARRASEAAMLRVQWHCASAEQLPLPDQAFDACFCIQGLQFFPDRARALAEMRRVLKSTGRLVTSTWASLPSCVGYAALIGALERQGVDTAAPRKAFSFGDPGDLHRAAAQAGYRSVEVYTEDGFGRCPSVEAFVDMLAAGSTTLRQLIAALSDECRRRLVEDTRAALAPYEGDDFRWPMRARILHARA